MAGKHTIEVSVLADTKKFAGAMKELGSASGLSKLGGIAKTAGKAVAGIGAAAAVAAGGLVAVGVRGAADLEQSIGAVDTVFKGSADQIHDWAKSAATDVGLTQNEFNELATILGTQLKNGGTAMEELGGKTNELMGLGSDLAAMFGGTTSDAVGALSSALKGERDPIEAYGVSLKQASIDAKAAELGFSKVGGALTDEAQQAATLALIMEQTADAHGTFAKESDTLAGKQQRLEATLGNLSTRLGTVFLPIVTQIAGWVGENVVPALERWAGVLETNLAPALATASAWMSDTLVPAIQAMAGWIMDNVVPAIQTMGSYITGTLVPALAGFGQWLIDAQGWLLPLAAAIGGMVLAWQLWTTAVQTWQAITKVASAVQLAFNAVLAANPIGLVVLAIAGLVAALVVLYNNNETVKNAIDAAWSFIKAAVSAVADWITGTAVPAITGAWDYLSGAVGALGSAIQTKWDEIRSAIGSVGDWITGTAVPAITGAWDRIKTGVGDMVQAARDKFDSFRDGISNLADRIGEVIGRILDAFADFARGVGEKVGEVLRFFIELPGKIVDALVNLPSSLKGVGSNLVTGLIDGIKSMASRAVSAVKNVVGDAIGAAKKLLGIQSPSRVFRLIGRQTGDGLQIGLRDGRNGIRDAARDLAATVTRYGTPEALTATALAGGASTGRGPTVVQLHLHGLLYPTADTGRQIAQAIRPYLTAGGAI